MGRSGEVPGALWQNLFEKLAESATPVLRAMLTCEFFQIVEE